MSFNVITGATGVFRERANGTYVKDDVSFGSPQDELRIRPNTSTKNPSVTVTRYKQVDYTPPGATAPTRVAATVLVSIQMSPNGISSTVPDEMLADINTFIAADTLSRMLQGEA